MVGALALLVLLGVGAIVGYLWWHWRKLKKSLAAELPPLSIDLVADRDPGWTTEVPFKDVLLDLQALGFTPIGPYEVVGIAGVRLMGFCHTPSGFFACCYNHPVVGCFVDLCANLAGGLELTVTNAPTGGEIETRPGTEKIFLGGQPLAELYATLQTKIAGRPVRPCAVERFREEFIASYARDMAWRTSNLGVSEAEFRRVGAHDQRTYTEEQLTAAFAEAKLQELRQWSAEAAKVFAETTDLSVARWREFEHSLLIFRDDLHPAAYLAYLGETLALPDATCAKLRTQLAADTSLRGLLDKAAAAGGHTFVRLGTVDRPLLCEVFGVKPPVVPD